MKKNIKKNGASVSAKKIILYVACVCAAFLILCGAFYLISSIIGNKDDSPDVKIKFYSEEYSRDIMNDKGYLDLDRQFYFSDTSNGLTVAVCDDTASSVPADMRDAFLCIKQYISYAIAGDAKSLNRLYSDKFFAGGGKGKDRLTEQKIYDIYISGDSSGVNGSSVSLTVEYKIMHNNGSFRNDMGSNCSKREYFTVTDYNGNWEIDQISSYQSAGNRM